MEEIAYEDVVRPKLRRGASIRKDFPGFREDYLALHCLIRRFRPERFFEIGTSTGLGTRVICKAMSRRPLWPDTRDRVMSLDVPPGTDPAIIYPEGEDGHPGDPGVRNPYPYQQILGDSRTFDIGPHLPVDGWFIDGKHDFEYARSDTLLALSSQPAFISWHDMQIEGVAAAVSEVMNNRPDYRVRRVRGTRVGYAVRET